MAKSRKWLKWGIGAGVTLTVALLFQAVKQSDAFLLAASSKQERQPSQTARLSEGDAPGLYRWQRPSFQIEPIPETDSALPFAFTFPDESVKSPETTPQTRTRASSVAPGKTMEGLQEHQYRKNKSNRNQDHWDERQEKTHEEHKNTHGEHKKTYEGHKNIHEKDEGKHPGNRFIILGKPDAAASHANRS